VPDRGTLWGLFGALSETRNDEVRTFLRLGVKVTFTVQLAPGASPMPPIGQLLVCAKSPVLPPPMVMPERIRFDPPVLVMVTGSGLLVTPTLVAGKVSDAGLGVIAGAVIPVPVSVTLCGLVASESVIVSFPVMTPAVVGTKATLMRQLRPAARLVPQLLESEKPALQVMPVIVSVVVPTFASVTVCEELRVPTNWFPNSSENVLRLMLLTTCVAGVEVLVRKFPSPE
jgi:hypothetical protein